jgi:hypothetical protein
MRSTTQNKPIRQSISRRIRLRTRRFSIRIRIQKKEEEVQVAETTRTRTASTATSAKFKGIGRKNAGNESKRTNLVEMPKDGLTGQGSTSWTKIQKRNRSTPFITMKPDTRTMRMMHSTLLELTLIESISQEPQPFPAKFGFSEKSWMTPLIQAPSIIPRLILSLCTVSVATCNKLLENMTPFYGDKTKIMGNIKNKNFY